MAYELTVSRLIAPFYGNSVYTWGILLSVVMAALALGYFLGGRMADKTKRLELTLAFVLFASGLILFISYYVSQRLLQQSLHLLALSSSAWLYLVVLSLATLGSFAPAMTILGMVSPLLMKLSVKGLRSVGNTAGLLSMMGSIGGIIGSLTASFVLIPALGVFHSIQFLAILLSLTFLLVVSNKKSLQISALSVICIVFLGRFSQILSTKARADVEVESLYNHIKISDINGTKYLSTGNSRGVQSISIPPNGIMNNYLDYFALSPSLLHSEESHSVLLIGVAGGTVIKQLNQFFPGKVKIDAVEIDPKMIELAKKYFELSDAEANIIVGEGRQYVATTEEKYDVVLVDAFSTDLFAPSHLMTREFFEQVKSILNPEGVLVFNAVSPEKAQEGETLYQAIVNTVASVFPTVYHIPMRDDQFALGNHVLIAANSDFGTSDVLSSVAGQEAQKLAQTMQDRMQLVDYNPTQLVLTDDRAPVELLYWKMLGK